MSGDDSARTVRALKALLAEAEGKPLKRAQKRDADWYRASAAEATIAAYVAAVPKGDYVRLSGRQHKLLADQARLYDLPVDGPTVDLAAALSAMHDLIAANARLIRGNADPDERATLEIAKLEEELDRLKIGNEKQRIELRKLMGELVVVKEIKPAMLQVMAGLRQKLEPIASQNESLRDMTNDAIESLALEIEEGRLNFDEP